MSMKGKARIMAAEALRGIAKVQKIKGRLHVLRTEATGRVRDWQRAVTKAVHQVLPHWEAIKADGGLVIFSCLTEQGQRP